MKVRVVSDGETIRGEYADGNTWLPIGRAAKIGTGVQVGVYAADNAADGPIVPYDFISLNAQSEEFAGDAIEKCRWSQIVREEAAGYRVANGALEIDTGSGEVNDTAPNLIGQPVPGGSWEAETKVDLATTSRASRPACCSTRRRRTGPRSCSSAPARPPRRSSSSASSTTPTSSTRRSRSTSPTTSQASTSG